MRACRSAITSLFLSTAGVASIAVILALGGATGLRAAEDAPPPVEGWTSPTLGLRLLPPTGWSLRPGPSADSILLAPWRGKGQISLLSLPVAAAGAAPEPVLGELVDAALRSLKEKVAGFKLLERRDSLAGKLPAQEIYFRGKVEGQKYRWVQTIFMRGSRQVILMYTAPDETFPQFLGDYDQVVRSMVIVP
jgi:hypothetical protein